MNQKIAYSQDKTVTVYLFSDSSKQRVDLSIYIIAPMGYKVVPAALITDTLNKIIDLIENYGYPYYNQDQLETVLKLPLNPVYTTSTKLKADKKITSSSAITCPDDITTLISFIYVVDPGAPQHVDYFSYSLPCVPHNIIVQGPGGTSQSKISEIAD